MPITTWEAALGTKKTINLFDEDINIIVPKCCSSGQNIKIEQKGYKNGKGKRGNLHIVTKIVFKKTISKEEENLYEKLSKLETKQTK